MNDDDWLNVERSAVTRALIETASNVESPERMSLASDAVCLAAQLSLMKLPHHRGNRGHKRTLASIRHYILTRVVDPLLATVNEGVGRIITFGDVQVLGPSIENRLRHLVGSHLASAEPLDAEWREFFTECRTRAVAVHRAVLDRAVFGPSAPTSAPPRIRFDPDSSYTALPAFEDVPPRAASDDPQWLGYLIHAPSATSDGLPAAKRHRAQSSNVVSVRELVLSTLTPELRAGVAMLARENVQLASFVDQLRLLETVWGVNVEDPHRESIWCAELVRSLRPTASVTDEPMRYLAATVAAVLMKS